MNHKINVITSLLSIFLLLMIPMQSIESFVNKPVHLNTEKYHDELICFEKLIMTDSIINTNQNNETSYYALITGCTVYEDSRYNIPRPPNEPLPESSMMLIYNELVKAPNWKEENIILLLNEKATKDAIISAINNLSEQIDKDNVFYFSWTGHGAQIDDIDGDEFDGYDEAIVPYDANSMYNESLITDDELEIALSNIAAKSQFLLFESCLSGGMIQNHSMPMTKMIDVDKDGRIVVMLTPNEKLGFVSYEGWSMSMLFSEAFSNKSTDQNSDGWISVEEAFKQVDEKYPLEEQKLFIDIFNSSEPYLKFQFLIMYIILKIIGLKQIPTIILSSIWMNMYPFLYKQDLYQLFLANFAIAICGILGAKNDPNMNDQHLGELNFIKII